MQNIVLSLPAQIPVHAREQTRSQPFTEASAKPRFPVIESLTRSPIASGLPLRGLFVPQVLHARYSVVAVNEALIRLGAEPSNLVLLYKDYAYPERDEVLRELAEMGIHVAPLADIKPELARLKERLMATAGRFLALDDGGYIACAVAADPALMAHAVGYVEQTTRGVNAVRQRYHDLGQPMQKPHLSLPCSELKRTFECGPVGEIFMEALAWHAGGQSSSAPRTA